MKNAVIIGCGYVGKSVANYWYNSKLQVTVTTTTPAKICELQNVAHSVAVLKGNDFERLKSVIQGQHTVLLSVGSPNAYLYKETYLETAETLIKVLAETPTVEQVIYTGSYGIYGDQKGAKVDENYPVKPANENGEILQQTEEILLSANSDNLKVCILRLGGIYGTGRELIKIFNKFAGTTRPGDGQDITNWIHLDDIVAAIEWVRKHQLEGIYNLVDDAHLTYQELLYKLFIEHGLNPVNWDNSVSSNRPYNAYVSNDKIKQTGYELIHPQIIF